MRRRRRLIGALLAGMLAGSLTALSAQVTPPLADGVPACPLVRGWVASLGGATGTFWARVAAAGTPLLEPLDDGRSLRASFLWRGAGTREVQMFWPVRRHDRDTFTRLPGSDLWHFSVRLPADAHLSYQIAPDVPRLPDADRLTQRRAILQVARADPLNPRRWPRADESDARRAHSLLLGPQAPALPDATPVAQTDRGSLQTLEWTSRRLGNTRPLSLYLPARAPARGHALPLLLLLDRDPWLDRVPTPALLDRLIADGRVPPLAAVLVGYPTPEHRARELPCDPAFADAMALELLPWLRAQAPITSEPQRTVVAGASYGGLAAAWFGLQHPQVFGRVLSLSGSFWWGPDATPASGSGSLDDRREAEWLTRRYAEAPVGAVRYLLSAGLFERSAPNDGPGILDATRHLRDVLRARGLAVQHREFAGGHDHLAWQRELLEGLGLLLTPAADTRP